MKERFTKPNRFLFARVVTFKGLPSYRRAPNLALEKFYTEIFESNRPIAIQLQNIL